MQSLNKVYFIQTRYRKELPTSGTLTSIISSKVVISIVELLELFEGVFKLKLESGMVQLM